MSGSENKTAEEAEASAAEKKAAEENMVVDRDLAKRADAAWDTFTGDSEAEADYGTGAQVTLLEGRRSKEFTLEELSAQPSRPEISCSIWVHLPDGSHVSMDESWPVSDENADHADSVRELIGSLSEALTHRFR